MLALLGRTTDFALTCATAGAYQKKHKGEPLLTVHNDAYRTIGGAPPSPLAQAARRFLAGEVGQEAVFSELKPKHRTRSVMAVYEDAMLVFQCDPDRFYLADMRPQVGQILVADNVAMLSDVLLSVGLFNTVSVSQLTSDLWLFRQGEKWAIRRLPADLLNSTLRSKR